MAKLGQIKLIPSIRGEREFLIDRTKILDGNSEEQKELYEFTALIHWFSHNKAPLMLNVRAYEDLYLNVTRVLLEWYPKYG